MRYLAWANVTVNAPQLEGQSGATAAERAADSANPMPVGARRHSLSTNPSARSNSSGSGNRPDFKAINQAALAALPAILARFASEGEYRGSEYVMRNPHRDDKHLGSLSINTRTGRWADFAMANRGGDVISLVAFLLNVRQGEAARGLASMLELASEVSGDV